MKTNICLDRLGSSGWGLGWGTRRVIGGHYDDDDDGRIWYQGFGLSLFPRCLDPAAGCSKALKYGSGAIIPPVKRPAPRTLTRAFFRGLQEVPTRRLDAPKR